MSSEQRYPYTDEPPVPPQADRLEAVDRPPEVADVSPGIPSNADDRQMALFCHLGGALFGFLAPLLIWVMKKDTSKFIDDQGKEALNFQITLMIGHLIGGVSACVTFGSINLLLWVLGLVFGILGGLAANKGEVYRYPFNVRLVT